MDWLVGPDVWLAFGTLLLLEIVLGIDNVVFISILAGRLPARQRARARFVGLALALVARVLLLFSLSWVIGLTAPLLTVAGHDLSGRDLILLGGGVFLVVKSGREIHRRVEGADGEAGPRQVASSLAGVLVQIVALDLVFSLDSVITAVGMVDQLAVMVAAVVVAIAVMMALAGRIGAFVHRYPTVKMLALAFLLVIGVSLIADGLGFQVPKGYVYGPIAFSLLVEGLNLWAAARQRERARL